MKLSIIKRIINEELNRLNEMRMTKGFRKATENYQDLMVKQQNLKKKFVAEKQPKKREKLKKELIALHKKVQKAEDVFNRALMGEPIDPTEI
tara:strand:+ start:776 stop:1051 length:276 start_codon:yes stop_codon:yes gene_type:complete